MTYYLVHRYGPKDKPKCSKEPFLTESEAVTGHAPSFHPAKTEIS